MSATSTAQASRSSSALLARARKAKRRLLVYGLSPHYQEIFQITRLADFMAIYADEASALGQRQNA